MNKKTNKNLKFILIICFLSGTLVGVVAMGYFYNELKNEYIQAKNEIKLLKEVKINDNDKLYIPESRFKETIDTSIMKDKNRPEKFQSSQIATFSLLLPGFIRDFAEIEGIKDGYIVLYVRKTGLQPEPMEWNMSTQRWETSLTCFDSDYGQTITGVYRLAYIRSGKLINEISVPFPDYDEWPVYTDENPDPDFGTDKYTMINDPDGAWAKFGSLMFREDVNARDLIGDDVAKAAYKHDYRETDLLSLTDLTGDGVANEFRLRTSYISCGNNYNVIGGYDSGSDQVMIYKIADENGIYPSYDNFRPSADGKVTHDTGCDHGALWHTIRKFSFKQKEKQYTLDSSTGPEKCYP